MLIYINKDYFWNSSRTEVNHARNKSDLFPWFLPDYPEILKNFPDFSLTFFRKSKFPDFPHLADTLTWGIIAVTLLGHSIFWNLLNMPTKKAISNLNKTSILCQETKQRIELKHLQPFIADLGWLIISA